MAHDHLKMSVAQQASRAITALIMPLGVQPSSNGEVVTGLGDTYMPPVHQDQPQPEAGMS